MKLTLINIYPKDTMAKYLISSYVLKAYVDKFNKDDGLFINILNFSEVTDTLEIVNKLIQENPAYIGYSCYVWNIEKILAVIKLLKGQDNKAVHILGGPEISLKRILTFSSQTVGDHYIIGEGEKVLLDLLNYFKLKNGGIDAKLPDGVAAWFNDKIVYSENRERIDNLDDIPSIYLNNVIEERLYSKQQAFLETQRGCLFKCRYCVYHKKFSTISYYSLNRIFDELKYLIETKTLSALRIIDAVFTSNLERAKKIVKYLLELKNQQGVHFPWIYWEMTYTAVDEELIQLIALLKNKEQINNSDQIVPKNRPQHYSEMLKDYTAINCIGIQSFNNESLKAVGRPRIISERFAGFVSIINRNNVVLKLDLIMGLPFETFDTYFDGLEWFLPYFKDTDHILNIHRLQILPGSDLENMCSDYGVNYSEKAPHMVSSTRHFPEQQLSYASKLTAVLFRVVNSPLRKEFYNAKDRSRQSYFDVVKNIHDEIIRSSVFQDTKFVNARSLDDEYWNNNIYSEIPSRWLVGCLKVIK